MRRRVRRLPRPGCPGSGEGAAAMSKKRLQQLVESLSRSAKHCECRAGPEMAGGRLLCPATRP